MKSFITFTAALTFFLAGHLHAQEFQGEATYKTQRKLDIKLDSTQVDSQMQEQLMAMMKKQFEREFTLEFDNDESIYKVVEALDAPSAMGGGVQIVVAGSGSESVLYRNTAENRFVNKTDLFGKTFLIKDQIQAQDWTLTKETKNIGEYTCFKATRTETRTVMTAMSSEGGQDDGSDSETTEQEVIITAWYTPMIPVGHGPSNYGGLPGLILEASDGSETILCSKIILNPNKGVNLDEPTKGKEVTQAEFDEIMEAKMQEMQERYQPRRNGEHSGGFEIRIGG